MTNETGKRIKALRQSRGMTQQQVAELVGTKSYTTIAHWESGKNSPQGKDLIILSDFFKVSVDSILGIEHLQITEQQIQEYDFLPISIAAGLPSIVDSLTEDDIEQISIPDIVMGKWAGYDGVFITKVNGDSMNKVIPHDTLIAVKRVSLDNLTNNDIVVFSNDHNYSVKRYYNDVENQRLIFSSESTNRAFSDITVPYEATENLIIHGKVVVYIVNLD